MFQDEDFWAAQSKKIKMYAKSPHLQQKNADPFCESPVADAFWGKKHAARNLQVHCRKQLLKKTCNSFLHFWIASNLIAKKIHGLIRITTWLICLRHAEETLVRETAWIIHEAVWLTRRNNESSCTATSSFPVFDRGWSDGGRRAYIYQVHGPGLRPCTQECFKIMQFSTKGSWHYLGGGRQASLFSFLGTSPPPDHTPRFAPKNFESGWKKVGRKRLQV